MAVMWSIAHERDDPTEWDVVRPKRIDRVAGTDMAGFGVRDLTALRLVPHPTVMLALEFGPGRPVVEHADGRRQRGSLVAGLGFGVGGSVRIRGEDVECVQVRLSPVVSRAVLGVCPADLDGAVVALDDLWGREASRVRERLGATSSWEERFALVNELCMRRHESGPSVDPEVLRVWERIVTGRGSIRVDRLADEVGWSRKRLWSRFNSQIGLPPKRAARLVRFDRVVRRLVAGEGAARAAADGGYADQAHLCRDVMAFTGTTPTGVAGEPWLTVDDLAWPAA